MEIARQNLGRCKQGTREQGDFEYTRKNGQRVYTGFGTLATKDEVGNYTCTMATVQDVKERKKAEEELRQNHNHREELAEKRTTELKKANEQLKREISKHKQVEDKLQELYQREGSLRRELQEQARQRTEFTRVLVHELKTPLTPMRAATDLLISQSPQEPLLSLAQKIDRGICNLDKRIDELLDLSRGEIGMLKLNCRLLDVAQLLRGVADYVSPEVSKNGQSLVLNLAPSLPPVIADEDRLRQVVLNFLINAFKFTPKGGKITLKARQRGTNLVVEVQDTGCGIDKGEQRRLFQPYYRLENDRERFSGLGLGLALSKMLVVLHGGKVWVKSEKAKGSEFGFSIPLVNSTKNTIGH